MANCSYCGGHFDPYYADNNFTIRGIREEKEICSLECLADFGKVALKLKKDLDKLSEQINNTLGTNELYYKVSISVDRNSSLQASGEITDKQMEKLKKSEIDIVKELMSMEIKGYSIIDIKINKKSVSFKIISKAQEKRMMG